MDTAIAVALLGFGGSLVAALVTYWFAKQRDHEAERRKEKLAYYKAFVESFSGIVDGEETPEGLVAFNRATNNLLLFAPHSVLEAVNAYRTEIGISNSQNRTREKHDALLAKLLLAIRADIGVVPPDDAETFKPGIWASGVRKSAT